MRRWYRHHIAVVGPTQEIPIWDARVQLDPAVKELQLDIGGRVHAGGGGSGGMIGLEAESSTLQGSAVLTANGGGGGGGGNGAGMDGEDAPVDGVQAQGGIGENAQGGNGGHGGHGTTLDGFPGGVAPARGGGGGGGAAGFIVYYGVAPSGAATRISPAPTTIP